MTAIYLNADVRENDYWLTEIEQGVLVDLSGDFMSRYHDAVNNYDAIQAELELIYKSKEV